MIAIAHWDSNQFLVQTVSFPCIQATSKSSSHMPSGPRVRTGSDVANDNAVCALAMTIGGSDVAEKTLTFNTSSSTSNAFAPKGPVY